MYMTKFHQSLKYLLTLSAFLLSGCELNPGPVPQNIDRSFTEEELCNPPCWHGLVINTSTTNDVISTLNTLPFVEHGNYHEMSTVWTDGNPATHLLFYCASDPSELCGYAILSKNVLKSLWTNLEYDLMLIDVVNRIGNPEYIEYEWPSLSGKCAITVLWNSLGLLMIFYDDSSNNQCEVLLSGGKFSRDILVHSIGYSSFEGFGPIGDCCTRISWVGFNDE